MNKLIGALIGMMVLGSVATVEASEACDAQYATCLGWAASQEDSCRRYCAPNHDPAYCDQVCSDYGASYRQSCADEHEACSTQEPYTPDEQ